MQRIVTTAVVLCLASLALAPPAAAQSREQRQMMAALQMLQEQTQQLTIAVSALQQQIDESVKTLNGRIDEATTATRRGLADQKLLIDNMAVDVRVVRERGDDTNVRISTLREELEALRTSIQALQPPPPPLVFDPADPDAPVPVSPPVAAPAPSTAGLSPSRLYETARADYFAGQWSIAISGFEAFLKAFPRSENADDAQFYIGETYSAQNKWTEAVAAYTQVIQNYGGANAVPDAYYKRGLAHERLDQIDAARASWETAAKNFPESDAGRLAKQNLDRVGARRP